ncbi:agmatine deiminase family protein [Porphyromonas pogonae]|uniref:agmatine deiminase family protein n=1 Tax=Porphyromonas pogonae TaxID=867595 RepID=UPI002E7A657D|nr:agmatine deiminase family protein [Porphyromonas pogonae]
MTEKITLIPEWEKQDLIVISWPHKGSDWEYMLDEVTKCYLNIAENILGYEDLLILTPEPQEIKTLFSGKEYPHELFVMEMPSNDTWCRDYAPLSLRIRKDDKERTAVADYTFNGWGMKFASNFDNLLGRLLYISRAYAKDVEYINRLLLVLEGGSVESDGIGTILTTESCLLEPNRNPGFSPDELTDIIQESLGAERLLILKNGMLEGDDTDGHVDTLARFIDPCTIAYVKCYDNDDSHYRDLQEMEKELQGFTTSDGKPYQLIPLPLPKPMHDSNGCRLPATYANFLFVNDALLVPIYNQPEYDKMTLDALRNALPGREVVGIDCTALVQQHGSLHCATMQFPLGFMNKNKWK